MIDNAGYQRVSLVEKVGDCAVRGGVIDLFVDGDDHDGMACHPGDIRLREFLVGGDEHLAFLVEHIRGGRHAGLEFDPCHTFHLVIGPL